MKVEIDYISNIQKLEFNPCATCGKLNTYFWQYCKEHETTEDEVDPEALYGRGGGDEY